MFVLAVMTVMLLQYPACGWVFLSTGPGPDCIRLAFGRLSLVAASSTGLSYGPAWGAGMSLSLACFPPLEQACCRV